MIGAVEDERRRLVDRQRARAGRRVGDLARVQAERVEAEFAVGHGRDSTKEGAERSGIEASCRDQASAGATR